MLKEAEETLFTRPIPLARAERLKVIKDGCDKVLVDLQSLVEKYESLGTQSKRTWDRMGWGNEDIAEIRARLTSNITVLTAFISTSQVSVEAKLDKFIEEFRQGKKESSIISLQTVDSLSTDDRAAWRTIRNELEEIGISIAAFDANRNLIFNWFVRAVETGAFEEQNEHGTDEESNHIDEPDSPRSSDEQGRQGTGRQRHPASIPEDQTLVRPRLSQSAPTVEADVPERGPERLEQTVVPKPRVPTSRLRVSRAVALLVGMSRPRGRFIKAIHARDVGKALEILNDDGLFYLLDQKTLDKALWHTTRYIDGSEVLMTELIAKGADVNYTSSEFPETTPLWNSVGNKSYTKVLLLVDNGADVNWKGSHELYFAPRGGLVKGDLDILRFLLSSGVDVNARYHCLRIAGLRHYQDYTEMSLLQEAASLGAIAAIEVLLQYGAKVDNLTYHGTALMIAILKNQEDAAQFLLTKGADPNFKAASHDRWFTENSKVTYHDPIEAAIICGKRSAVQLLLNHGAVPDSSTLRFARGFARGFALQIGQTARIEQLNEHLNEHLQIIHLLESVLPDTDTVDSSTRARRASRHL